MVELNSALRITATSTGFDKATAELNALGQAEARAAMASDALVVAQSKVEQSVLSAQQKWDRLNRTIDAEYAAEQKIVRGQKIIDDAVRQNVVSKEMAAQASEKLIEKYRVANDNTHGLGETTGLTTNQLMTLESAVRHTVDSLLSGQNPMRALGIEAIKASSAIGEGGLSGLLKGATTFIGGLAASIPVAAYALTGLGATVALGYKAWSDYDDEVIKLSASLSGLGRSSGLTVAGLQSLARESAAASGISLHAANDLAAGYAATGRIGADTMRSLIAHTRDYAASTGADLATAGKDLAKIFADPAKGVDELNSKFNLLSDTTTQYVDRLVAQNRETEAQKILLDALPDRLISAERQVSAFARAWNFVKNAASEADLAIGATIDHALNGETLEERLTREKTGAQPNARGPGTLHRAGPPGRSRAEQINIETDEIYLQEIRDSKRRIAESAAGLLASRDIGEIVRTQQPDRADLQARIDKRDRLQADMAIPGSEATNFAAAKEVLDELNRSIVTNIDATTKKIMLAEIDAKAAAAKTAAEKGALAAERERIQLAGQVISTANADALIESERRKAFSTQAAKPVAVDGFQTALVNADKRNREIASAAALIGKTTAEIEASKLAIDLETAAKLANTKAGEGNNAVTRSQRAEIAAAVAARRQQIEADDAAKKHLDAINQSEGFFAQQGFDLFNGLTVGARSFSDALGGISNALLTAIEQATLLGSGPLAGLFGTKPSVSGETGGLFGALAGSLGGLFGGGSAGPMSLMPAGFSGAHAMGGDVPMGTWGIAGEAGPEIVKGPATVVPLRRGSGGGDSGSGAPHVQINHYNNHPIAEVQSRTRQDGSRQIIDFFISETKREFAKGGFDQVLQQSHGLAPKALRR